MPNYVVVVCPNCLQKYRVAEDKLGQRATCRQCGEQFKIKLEGEVDEDTVFGWVTSDDPGDTGVMGGTGIFDASGKTEPAAGRWKHPTPPATPRVTFDRTDDIGAYFEFPVELLADRELRCSFPHRCVHCLNERDLSVHLLVWGDKLPRADALRLAEAEHRAVRKLEDLMSPDPEFWLERLEPVAVLPPPFSLPFPYFVCGQCSAIGEVVCHVLNHDGKEYGQIAIANLAVAVEFYRNNGGRGEPGYKQLMDARRQQESDQWKRLPFAVRAKISQWFTQQEGEEFLGYFADEDFSRSETGAAGLVLTSKRMVYKKYASHREYPLGKDGSLFIEATRATAIIEISQEGERDAMLTLRPTSASCLARALADLKRPWQIRVSTTET